MTYDANFDQFFFSMINYSKNSITSKNSNSLKRYDSSFSSILVQIFFELRSTIAQMRMINLQLRNNLNDTNAFEYVIDCIFDK